MTNIGNIVKIFKLYCQKIIKDAYQKGLFIDFIAACGQLNFSILKFQYLNKIKLIC